MSWIPRLTTSYLQSLEPCPDGLADFQRHYPDGLAVTASTVRKFLTTRTFDPEFRYLNWLGGALKVPLIMSLRSEPYSAYRVLRAALYYHDHPDQPLPFPEVGFITICDGHAFLAESHPRYFIGEGSGLRVVSHFLDRELVVRTRTESYKQLLRRAVDRLTDLNKEQKHA